MKSVHKSMENLKRHEIWYIHFQGSCSYHSTVVCEKNKSLWDQGLIKAWKFMAFCSGSWKVNENNFYLKYIIADIFFSIVLQLFLVNDCILINLGSGKDCESHGKGHEKSWTVGLGKTTHCVKDAPAFFVLLFYLFFLFDCNMLN